MELLSRESVILSIHDSVGLLIEFTFIVKKCSRNSYPTNTLDSNQASYRLNSLSLTMKVNLPLPEMYSCCTQKSAFQTLDKLVSDESNNEARGVKLRYLSGLRPFSNIHFNFKFHCSHLIFYVTLTFFLLVRSWLDRKEDW